MNSDHLSDAPVRVRTYGNWRVPKAAGYGKLSFAGSLFLLASLIVAFVMYSTVGLKWTIGYCLISGLILFAITTKDRHGVTLTDRIGERMRFLHAKNKKTTQYRAGIASPVYTDGKCRLPGVLGAAKLTEHIDAYDRPFTLVHHADGTLAVTMTVAPAGSFLVDQDLIDQEVALWGMWLSDLAGEIGITWAMVTVETVPDTGARLEREVQARLDPKAPPLASHVLQDVITEYRTGATQVHTWVTLVFDPRKMGTKRRNDTQLARDIASRLPGLTQTLQGTGAGTVHLLTAQELCRLTRVAYDPASEALFEEAANRGQHVQITWADAGPVSASTEWDHYRHDSGLSRTWVVTRPPRGIVQSGVLSNILSTSRDVARKRVTILYKPIDAAKAPDLVESDLNKANAKVQSQVRPKARDLVEQQAAQRIAYEEASGAGLVDFGMVITATTMDDDLDDTASAVNSLASSSRLQVRPAYGTQDFAFALGLPLGLHPKQQLIAGGW